MRRFSLICLLMILTASLLQAQKRYDELNFPELNEFEKPDIETLTTSNGIEFFLLEDKELPLIDVRVVIRTGGVEVPENKVGLASITGTVMRSGGTVNYPADTLNQLLENRAASMETGIGFSSASAGMNVLKEDFEELLPIFIDLLKNPAFPEEKLELAKTQAKSGISRRNDNPGQIANREFDNLIYGENSVYSRTTEYETINNITRKDLVNFHKRYFNGNNMMVGVVGDFDTKEMKKKLREAFRTIPAGDPAELTFPEVDYNYQNTINLADKPDVNQSTVYLGHIGGMRNNPDYAEVQVMNNVLSGGFSGRLFQKVRTDLGLAYSVGGQYGMGNTFYPGQFFVQVQTKTETTSEAIDAIIGEIKRLQNEPISREELQDTKDQFLNSLVFRNTSYEQILNRRINNKYRGLSEDSFEKFIEEVKQTTVEDVQKMAQKYLKPEQLEILVVGNKSELGDQLEKYGTVNEIDISIPQPGSDQQEVVEGDAQKGRELLDKMADSIIKPGTELKSLTISGEILIPQQGQTLPMTMTIDYPEDIEQSLQTPGGTMKLSYKDGKGTMSMAGQERSLPASSPMISNLRSALNRSVVAIAKKADELEPQFTGSEQVDGVMYNKISMNVGDKNVTLFINTETNLPGLMRYQEFNPQQGSNVTIEDHYSEWTMKEGVAYPYKQVSVVDGNEAAQQTVESHKVNEN